MGGKNSLYWQYIRKMKLQRYFKSTPSNEARVRDEITQICKKLNQKIKHRRHYNFKLGCMGFVRHFYHVYIKAFRGFKTGNGPISIIGKVSKSGNCEYPNTFYYRITKCWGFL